MLGLFKSGKARKKLEAKIQEGNQYLDNNYRDLAKSCYCEMQQMLKDLDAELSDKDKQQLSREIENYATRMSHMGHY